MADNTKAIIALAKEMHSEVLDIKDDAEVRQEQGGCWVAAWVWVENVYIDDDNDDEAAWESHPEVEGPVCHNCDNTTWKHDTETGEDHCSACSQSQ